MADDIHLSFEIEKARSDGSIVRGWAYVSTDNGKPVIDHSGQHVDLDVIEKAMHDYVVNCRVAKSMHAGEQAGDLVECVIVDDAFCKAMGATTTKRGAWIGMKIHDEAVRKDVKSGKLKMFSIGGRGKITKVAG